MRQKEVKIPLYSGEMVMVQCDNWEKLKLVYKSALEKYSNQPDERHDGYVFEAYLPGGGTQYIVAFKGTPKGGVIAHGCVHLVNAVYANCVIPLDIYNDEHQAYLLEWFFDQIDNFFNTEKIIRPEHKPIEIGAIDTNFTKINNTMKINGYEYTENEILDALRQKGYLILPYKTYNENHIHGSFFQKEWYNTKCAVKGAEIPSDENIYTNVAIKEFQKEFTKPKL